MLAVDSVLCGSSRVKQTLCLMLLNSLDIIFQLCEHHKVNSSQLHCTPMLSKWSDTEYESIKMFYLSFG